MRNNRIFCLPSGAPHSGAAFGRKFDAKRRIAQGEFTSPEHSNAVGGSPLGFFRAGGGKKKMRTLGTVQLPTEAFMAVLKLDEE